MRSLDDSSDIGTAHSEINKSMANEEEGRRIFFSFSRKGWGRETNSNSPVQPAKQHAGSSRSRLNLTLAGLCTLVLILLPASGRSQTFSTIRSFGIITNITGNHPQSFLVQGPDGTLYGVASGGEGSVGGTIFKMQPDGTGFTILKLFTNSLEGARPESGLTLSGGVLYGTAYGGGGSGYGTVFKLNTNGTGFTVLKSFTGTDGRFPYAGVFLSGGVLYGTTVYGGTASYGTLFRMSTNGSGYQVLKNFDIGNTDGANPYADLVVSAGMIYGANANGGSSSFGTVFRVSTNGTGYTVLRTFAYADGISPHGALSLSGGVLYGTTIAGGSLDYGTVYKMNSDGSGFSVLKNFDDGDGGGTPYSPLVLSGNTLFGTAYDGGPSGFGNVYQINTDGSGFGVVWSFSGDDGSSPYAVPTLASGVLYGTTYDGGVSDLGTVFKVNTNGTGFGVLRNFSYSDSAYPLAGLTPSVNLLFGTTDSGGNPNYGTIFRLSTNGSGYTILKNFTGTDGENPQAILTLSGSTLYGTTSFGGSSNSGTIFQVNTDGTSFAVLWNFDNGATPYAGLVLSGATLYGTTYNGGTNGSGTIFAINKNGTGYTLLREFAGLDGANPAADLTLDPSGTIIYGTTEQGGPLNYGTVFKVNTDGTGFTQLRSFTNNDGAFPDAGLVLSGTVLYGTTSQGGSKGSGVVFKMNTDGSAFDVIKNFDYSTSDGTYPLAPLTLFGGVLYGTASAGGTAGYGTVFKLNTDGSGYTVLRTFDVTDGATPAGSLAALGNKLFGTTEYGGGLGDGTLFSIDLTPPIVLSIQHLANSVVLKWTNASVSLQSAPFATGTFTNIPGATSPYTNATSGTQKYYRLIVN